jgi:hypothetical protein
MSKMGYLEKLLDGVEVEWKPLGEVISLLIPKFMFFWQKNYASCS